MSGTSTSLIVVESDSDQELTELSGSPLKVLRSDRYQ